MFIFSLCYLNQGRKGVFVFHSNRIELSIVYSDTHSLDKKIQFKLSESCSAHWTSQTQFLEKKRKFWFKSGVRLQKGIVRLTHKYFFCTVFSYG